jgi:CBS-domain-containing membrane protein
MREYQALGHHRLDRGAMLAALPQPQRVTLDDSALAVMTDLRQVSAATTALDEIVDRAHAFMVRRGVRLLFVMDEQAAIVGVLTSTDLLGEKPMRFMQQRGVPHGDLLVADLMTPVAQLECVDLQEVAQMRVGHVVATFAAVRRMHLIVASQGGRQVCGLFSASQVARQLGMPLQPFEVAGTFADIEAILART